MHARQGALHARHRDDGIGLVEPVEVRDEAMQPGDAAVVDPLHTVAHGLGGDGGLLGHRHVGGARAHHRDEPDPLARSSA